MEMAVEVEVEVEVVLLLRLRCSYWCAGAGGAGGGGWRRPPLLFLAGGWRKDVQFTLQRCLFWCGVCGCGGYRLSLAKGWVGDRLRTHARAACLSRFSRDTLNFLQ